jgi:uncharacterized protein YjiS (DUF1127 family)
MTGAIAMEAKMQASVLALLKTMLDGCRTALARRRARREALLLRSMSERELRDLGIGRSEIPVLVRGDRDVR